MTVMIFFLKKKHASNLPVCSAGKERDWHSATGISIG